MSDEIRATAKAAAKWWRERFTFGDPDLFERAVERIVAERLGKGERCVLECDYEPLGDLRDAMLQADIRARGMFLYRTADFEHGPWVTDQDVLPQKHSLRVEPGRLLPKEGYGNWTREIAVRV